jgi:hypothetical protein
MPNAHTKRLLEIIGEIQAAHVESDRLMFDEQMPHELGPPCSPAQLEALETKLGRPIPPTYRAFLELHDGWENLVGDAKILAVEDHGSKWVKKRLDGLSVLFHDTDDDPIAKGAIPVVLGVDARQFVLLDPDVRHADGELDYVDYDLVRERRRLPSLIQYLEHKLQVLRTIIEEETQGEDD